MSTPLRPDAPDPARIGAFVAEHVEGTVTPAARLAARERLLRSVERSPQPWRLPAFVVATLAAAALVLWWSWPRTPADVGADTSPIAVAPHDSEWVQAPARGRASLPVGEGAALELQDGGRGRVSFADASRIAVVLEGGTLAAEVDPQARRACTIEAGPYRVAVVGTVFRVDWEPTHGRFVVEVTRGKVEVDTPSSSSPLSVDAGHRLVAEDGVVTLAAIAGEQPEPEPVVEPEPAHAEAPTPSEAPARAKAKPTTPADPAAATPTWQQLAAAGKYADALAAVEAAGFDDALATMPSATLEELGDAARLSGRAARAEQVYLAVRKRFAGTAAAARAAFQLGRLAARDHAAAIRWLQTYLDEAPQGSFAKLARGRLLSALAGAGDRAAARDAARVYLDSYPDGPHAKIARALLEAP